VPAAPAENNVIVERSWSGLFIGGEAPGSSICRFNLAQTSENPGTFSAAAQTASLLHSLKLKGPRLKDSASVAMGRKSRGLKIQLSVCGLPKFVAGRGSRSKSFSLYLRWGIEVRAFWQWVMVRL